MQKELDLSFQEDNQNSVNKFINNIIQLPEISVAIHVMKKADDEFTRASIKVNDVMKEQIIVMASSLENTYRDAGIPITQISTDIGHILMNVNLEKYIRLGYSVLDDKYKNPTKDRFKKQEQRIMSNTVEESYQHVEEIDFNKLDDDSLLKIYNRSIDLTDRARAVLASRNRPVLDDNTTTNTLTYISENEGFKFKKAEMGKPLVTVEQMTEDTTYKESFERLKKVFDRFLKATMQLKVWFCETYIPLSAEDCNELAEAIETFLEFWRPYFDHKYRMDHYDGIVAAINKVTRSSASAAKETAVQTLWIKDKKGNPAFRCMTKEQLEAVYRWEFNYVMELINTYIKWPEIVHRINSKHGERAKADRQVDLKETLSHYS